MKNSVIGLLALSTIGLMSVPALADEANVQRSEQVTTQEGDRNSSSQNARQSNRSSRNDRDGNFGNAQEVIQDTLQDGDDNVSEQTVEQSNDSRRNRSR